MSLYPVLFEDYELIFSQKLRALGYNTTNKADFKVKTNEVVLLILALPITREDIHLGEGGVQITVLGPKDDLNYKSTMEAARLVMQQIEKAIFNAEIPSINSLRSSIGPQKLYYENFERPGALVTFTFGAAGAKL